MKKPLIILAVGSMLFYTCKKDGSSRSLNGIYTESSPYKGRSQLDFISNDLVIKSESGSALKDTFKYVITGNKMSLTTISGLGNYKDGSYTFNADYQQISSTQFKIQNLYAQIPEAPETFMIFTK